MFFFLFFPESRILISVWFLHFKKSNLFDLTNFTLKRQHPTHAFFPSLTPSAFPNCPGEGPTEPRPMAEANTMATFERPPVIERLQNNMGKRKSTTPQKFVGGYLKKKKKKSSKKKLNSFSLLCHCPWGAVLCDALYNLNIFQLLQCLFVSKVELEVEENLFCWILRWWINMQIIDGDWPWPQLMQHFSGFCCERSVLLVQADCNFDLTVALQDLH